MPLPVRTPPVAQLTAILPLALASTDTTSRTANGDSPLGPCIPLPQVGPDADVAALVDDECKGTAAVSGSPRGSGSTSWKGRAQKILLLKAKLKAAGEEVRSGVDTLPIPAV